MILQSCIKDVFPELRVVGKNAVKECLFLDHTIIFKARITEFRRVFKVL